MNGFHTVYLFQQTLNTKTNKGVKMAFKTTINSDGAMIVNVNDVDVVTIGSDGLITLNKFASDSGFLKIASGAIISGPVILSEVEYDPANTSDWTIPVPETLQQAVDRLAAAQSIKP